MLRTIPHITGDQSRALSEIVAKIANETKAEKIICFGVRTSHDFIWSTFLRAPDEVRTVQYDLLILTEETEKTRRDEIAERVLRLSSPDLKFTVLVHGIESVNDQLKKGHYFFSSLFHKGVLLFDNEAISLNSPKLIAQSVADIEAYWRNRHSLACNFFSGATHAIDQGWHDQAMFLLHQAVELFCTSLIRVYMGYKVITHRLRKLLSMVENFALYSITAFPRITEEEIRLFNTLDKAYSSSRYDEEYTVSPETVKTLRQEVKYFLQIAEQLFLDRTKAENSCIEQRDVSSFDSIGLDTFARVVLKRGDTESVEIESEYGSAESIEVKIEDERLWISTINLKQDRVYDATVYITYRRLSGIVVNRVESLTSQDPIETESLGIIHNGQGNLVLELDVLSLDVTLNKHGDIRFSGSAEEARIVNNRSGDLDAKDLAVTSATVIVKGSGEVTVHVEDELHAELRGSGDLLILGSPRIKALATTGTGTFKISDKPKSYGKAES